MSLKIFQVDAFTGQLFTGNPAAVVPLEEWLPDTTMQQIEQPFRNGLFCERSIGISIAMVHPNG